MQNQCQLVVLLAEARIGAELVAAQERGEIAARNEPVSQYVQGPNILRKPTLPDIGIPRQRAAEYKALADAAVRQSRLVDNRRPGTPPGLRPHRRTGAGT